MPMCLQGFPRCSIVNNSPEIQDTETWVQYLGLEDTMEEGMATHSSTPAWRSPWTEEPGGLQYIESQRVGHDWSNLPQHMCLQPLNNEYFQLFLAVITNLRDEIIIS